MNFFVQKYKKSPRKKNHNVSLSRDIGFVLEYALAMGTISKHTRDERIISNNTEEIVSAVRPISKFVFDLIL